MKKINLISVVSLGLCATCDQYEEDCECAERFAADRAEPSSVRHVAPIEVEPPTVRRPGCPGRGRTLRGLGAARAYATADVTEVVEAVVVRVHDSARGLELTTPHAFLPIRAR